MVRQYSLYLTDLGRISSARVCIEYSLNNSNQDSVEQLIRDRLELARILAFYGHINECIEQVQRCQTSLSCVEEEIEKREYHNLNESIHSLLGYILIQSGDMVSALKEFTKATNYSRKKLQLHKSGLRKKYDWSGGKRVIRKIVSFRQVCVTGGRVCCYNLPSL